MTTWPVWKQRLFDREHARQQQLHDADHALIEAFYKQAAPMLVATRIDLRPATWPTIFRRILSGEGSPL